MDTARPDQLTQESLVQTLQRICELQPSYSSENTPEMEERGTLIRHTLVDELKSRSDALSAALGPFGEDFGVGASDGIGRKTQAPWVRFFSKAMSPSPREGYYFVLHFAADGSSVFFTLGCGSTRWADGMLYHLPDEELERRTQLARQLILREHPSLEPFTDQIELGAYAPLTKTFEKATAVAKRVDYGELSDTDLDALLVKLAGFLRSVYKGHSQGADLTPADQAVIEVEAIARPSKASSGGKQGYGLTGDERRAVELHAMTLASEWLRERGYSVQDKSASEPYDLEARKGELALKVEVKGTTSLEPSAVLMTSNEVELHRAEQGKTALIIVSAVELSRGPQPAASGGNVEALIGWDIDGWVISPTAFKVARV